MLLHVYARLLQTPAGSHFIVLSILTAHREHLSTARVCFAGNHGLI
jgi:hypothetical protein